MRNLVKILFCFGLAVFILNGGYFVPRVLAATASETLQSTPANISSQDTVWQNIFQRLNNILQQLSQVLNEIKTEISGGSSSGGSNSGSEKSLNSQDPSANPFTDKSGQDNFGSPQNQNSYQSNYSQNGNANQNANANQSSDNRDWLTKLMDKAKELIQGGSNSNQKSGQGDQQKNSNQNSNQQNNNSSQSNDNSGQSGDNGGQTSGEENGTPKNPYKLEPNQFKKICGTNTYVLYWRIGGQNKRDMAHAKKDGEGGKQGAENTWIVPTCEELSKCHCCCNTCTFPQGLVCPQGWCFSKKTICDDKEECTDKCSNKCDEKCKKGCEDYKEPTHDKAFNRDCKCNMEGCENGAKGCKIVIMDPGKSQVEYTKADADKPEKYYKGTGAAIFQNGNSKSQEQSKIKSEGKDVASGGWVDKLKGQPGVCCKCYQDGPQIQ